MKHFLDDNLPAGEGSRAYWADRPDRNALVFVHGFRGKAVKTWRTFPRLLLQVPSLDGWDLIFFGYESAKRQAAKSAEEFLHFLRKLATSPGSLMNLTGEARRDRPESGSTPFYERIYVVAHSLGAAVARHALVQAQIDEAWMPCVQLVLYAPAHAGAKSVDALVDAVGDGLGARFFIRLKLHNMPVIDDLTKKTSFLKQLHDRTQERLALSGHNYLVAKAIVDAEYEKVVDQVKFIDEDPDGEMIRGTTHTSVCKPKLSKLQPLERLWEVL